MPIRPLLVLLLLCSAVLSAERPAVAVWKLDNTNSLGGYPATCTGTPQVIETPDGKALHFNGRDESVQVSVNPIMGRTSFTIEALIMPDADGPEAQRFLHIQDQSNNRALMEIRLGKEGWSLDTFLHTEKPKSERTLLDRTKTHPANRWTWVALVFDKSHMSHYVNGVKDGEVEMTFAPMSPGKISLGARLNQVSWFKGSIRELRFHARALAPVAMQQN